MSPPVETMMLKLVQLSKPVFKSEPGKIAYMAHTYLTASGCTLVGCGEPPPQSAEVVNAPELDLPAQWEGPDGLTQLWYRTPAGKQLELKCLSMGPSTLLHWSTGEAGASIQSVQLTTGDYVTACASGVDAYNKDKVGDLLQKISPGLDLQLQGKDARAPSQSASEQRPQQQSALPERAADRQPNEFAQPVPSPLEDRGLARPLPPGYRDLYGPGMGPMFPDMGMGGTSHVGPDDPIFHQARRPGGGLGSLARPPGARYDPISPEGIPGFSPDDFTPAQTRQDAWNDMGPPPGRFGPGGMRGPDMFG